MSKTSPRMALQQQGSCEGGEANGSHDSNSRYCERRLPVERASLTALQESVKALVTNVTSGRKSGVFCRKLSPDGSWEKTSQACFPQIMETSSVEHSLTWPRWGTLLDGVLMEQSMWERGIEETGCSLLPTPRSGKTTDENEETWTLRQQSGKVSTPPLSLAVKMLPTPQSRDWKDSGDNVDWKKVKNKSKLSGYVMFPTPSANEDAAGTPQGNMQKMLGNCPEVRQQGEGSLNPEWVTWLMGFPPGWLNPMESQELPAESKPE